MSSQETGAVDLSEDFDQIAIVVDWLDACRNRDLDALLELVLTKVRASRCCCGGTQRHQGLAALAAYWRPQFEAFGADGVLAWRRSRRPPRASRSTT